MTSLQDMERIAHRFDELALGRTKTSVLVFKCPLCGRRERGDTTKMAPSCTGPTWRDEHQMTVMELAAR